jgi:hypothetical protein
MSTISTKIQTGTAACAIALAATLTPAAIANASPVSPATASLGGSAGVGSAVVAPECFPVGSPACEAAVGISASGGAIVRSIFQNRFVWIGTPNPTPPERTTIFVFAPLGLIPGFIRPLYSWFTQNLNFETCVLGASVKVGPYGTVTGSVGKGC